MITPQYRIAKWVALSSESTFTVSGKRFATDRRERCEMALSSLIALAGLIAAQILNSARHPHVLVSVRALAELLDLGTEALPGVAAISLLVLGLHLLADLLESGAEPTSLRPTADTEGR
ncbi:hypothetical protein [Nonomuraea dietziae]|uniref:hypothetical protein n=1 Tax=Nonomuraea dietziae TaxID=65515 RepID=UPI0033EFDD85